MDDNKLKIVFISSWYPHKLKPLNGIFVKRHAVANTIDCNVSVIFICSDKNDSIEETVEDGIYTIRGYYKLPKLKIPPIFHIIKLARYLLLWKKLWGIYSRKKGKPDLINSTIVYPVSIIATLIKFIWNVPYVITEHWSGYFPEDGNYNGFIKKIISKIVVSNAQAVITDSAKLGSMMLSLGLNNRYFTIPNVVDPEVFNIISMNTKSAVRNIRSESYFHFIHVSSLDDGQKNINGMLRAFRKFHSKHPLAKFTIIWDEEEKEHLEKIKEPFSDETGVFLTGKKEGNELAAFLRESNAFILFSNYESLPVVMLESFCCGVPIIGTRVGDVPEYINKKNGLLIDSKNEDQLLEAMENMFKNSENYNPHEIRDMIVNRVSPSAVSKQFTDVYKIVLSSN
jgi:glycosyltransferase involved in cell wall biosynthesis